MLYFTALGMQQARVIQEGLLATYGNHVRLIAKVMPPLPGGRWFDPPLVGKALEQPEAASMVQEAALYAHTQGKFWEFHDAFGRRDFPYPAKARIEEIAQQIGLDVADLNAALADQRFRDRIAEDNEAVQAADLRGFAFLVDGRRAEGATALAQMVEAAIRKSGRRPPPRPKNSAALATNPADPSYDAQALMMHLNPRQLFGVEPRDSAWADAIEKVLRPMVERDLRGYEPKLASTTVDCRSTHCRLAIQAGKGNEADLIAAARYLYGAMQLRGTKELFLGLRANGATAADVSLAKLHARRSTVIYNHRTGRARPNLGFPVARLPKE